MTDEQKPAENEQHEDAADAQAAAAQPAETEAHGARATHRRDDDDPDVEAHRAYATSDARLKTDIRPLLG